ncbi:hypothetical protein G6F35_016626 [Rhizopus arrhizus]|nr:hypothetical protein G6F35_016626 [Rhizopus arrhizus]
MQAIGDPAVPLFVQFVHGRMLRQHRDHAVEELAEQHRVDRPGANQHRRNRQQDQRQRDHPGRLMGLAAMMAVAVIVVTVVIMSMVVVAMAVAVVAGVEAFLAVEDQEYAKLAPQTLAWPAASMMFSFE